MFHTSDVRKPIFTRAAAMNTGQARKGEGLGPGTGQRTSKGVSELKELGVPFKTCTDTRVMS